MSATGAILVVDDNPVNRQMLAQHVAQLGHRVRTADDGREALRLLREGEFDLVLLDVVMPQMDGFAALKRVKADERLREALRRADSAGPEGLVRAVLEEVRRFSAGAPQADDETALALRYAARPSNGQGDAP